MTHRWGAAFERCNTPYLSYKFPHACLCPGCYLAQMTPWERGRLLGYVEQTGRRLP